MADLILSRQYLPSGCGFKAVRVDDAYVWDGMNNFANYKALRKWCRANCSGTFAYTPEPEILHDAERSPGFSSGGQFHQKSIQYFAFVDDEDITAVLLTMGMGMEGVRAKAMWPSRAKFTIVVRGL